MEPLSDPLIMNGSARAHNSNRHAAPRAGDIQSTAGESFKVEKRHNVAVKTGNNGHQIVQTRIVKHNYAHQ